MKKNLYLALFPLKNKTINTVQKKLICNHIFIIFLAFSSYQIPSVLHADFYATNYYVKNVVVKLSTVKNTEKPFVYLLTHNAEQMAPLSRQELVAIEKNAIDRPSFIYQITRDELNVIRKISRVRTQNGIRKNHSEIWLRATSGLARIKETIPQEISYEVLFDKQGRITTIATFANTNQPFSLTQRYSYSLTPDITGVINLITSNNNNLPSSVYANLLNDNTNIKTIDYTYNGKRTLRKTYLPSGLEIFLEPSTNGYKLHTYETTAKKLSSQRELSNGFPTNLNEKTSSTKSVESEVVTLFSSNHQKIEELTNTFEIKESNDQKQRKLLRSLSSKHLLTNYHYNTEGYLKKKSIVDSILGIAKKEFFYEYSDISMDTPLLFTQAFTKNAIQRSVFLLADMPMQMVERTQGFFHHLVGVRKTSFKGNAKLETRKKIEGNRIFSSSIKNGKLTNLNITTITGERLVDFTYSYYEDGRIFEEKKKGIREDDFTKVRYIYDSNIDYEKYANQVAQKKLSSDEKRLLAKLVHHRVGLGFLGKSLYNYLSTKNSKITAAHRIKELQKNLEKKASRKEPISSSLSPPLSSFQRKTISNDEVVLAQMQSVIKSGLSKVLYINDNEEVISYIRIDRSSETLEKKEIDNPDEVYSKNIPSPNISIVSKKNRKNFALSNLTTAPNLTEAQINNEAVVLNTVTPATNETNIKNTNTTVLNMVEETPLTSRERAKILRFTYYGKEPVFFFDIRRSSRRFLNRRSIISQTDNNTPFLKDGGKQDFRTTDNDKINLFAKEKILERYEFLYMDGRLPFKSKFERFDGKQAALREINYIEGGKAKKEAYKTYFDQYIEDSIINTPLFPQVSQKQTK